MKNNSMKKYLSLVLVIALTAALALAGCGKTETAPETTAAAVETTAAAAETTAAATEAAAETTAAAAEDAAETTAAATEAAEVTVLGEGAVSFHFVYSDLDGKETHYEIHTDKKTVGEALMENELVAGTVGEWGLMVETVGGLTLDFDKDGMYWGFFIDGEYAQTGVDSTDIVEGTTYSFVPSK